MGTWRRSKWGQGKVKAGFSLALSNGGAVSPRPSVPATEADVYVSDGALAITYREISASIMARAGGGNIMVEPFWRL